VARFVFADAVKAGSRIRLGLIGPYGAGKTFTALTFARGLGGTIGLVDTERRRAAKYADRFRFKHLPIDRFDPRDLTRITIDAAEQGIDTLIIDSWSPFWTGADGMLDQVGRASRDFEGWKNMRPVEREMTDALMGFPGHVIATLRTKVAYEVERNADGKMEPRKIGLKPEQRDGIEYEFDMVADMVAGGQSGPTMTITKSMCPELTIGTTIVRPDDQVAATVLAWLERDAIGQPLNPVTIAAWALDDARAVEELGAKFRELDAVGQAGAIVDNPWPTEGAGEFISVGNLLRHRGRQIQQDAQRAAREHLTPAA
jgi:hypothetical protein